MTAIVAFIAGLFVGSMVGLLVMALLVGAHDCTSEQRSLEMSD